MHSPQRFSLQSRNLPFISLTCVSLTMIVQSQFRILPWHPLELASRKKPLRDLPMGNGHKGPVFIATFEGIVCPIRSDMAYYPFWTSEFDAQITSPSVVNVH